MEITKEELKILVTAAHRSGGIETLKKMTEDNPELASKLTPIIEKWKQDNEKLWQKATEISRKFGQPEPTIKDLGLKNWLKGFLN